MNVAVYDYAPQIPARIRTRGDEFIGHGRTNSEEQAACSEDEERRLIGETTETFRRHEGQGPGGWMGPWISESERTPDLLKEAGYRYLLDWCADGQPYRLAGLRDILLHIVNHPNADKVWFTRPGAIYDHIVSLPEGVVP